MEASALITVATCGRGCPSWLATDYYSASAMALNSPAKMSPEGANGSLEYAGAMLSGTTGLWNQHPCRKNPAMEWHNS